MPQPNGTITLNQVWTPTQWNAAWASVGTDIAAAVAVESARAIAAEGNLAPTTSLTAETARAMAAEALLSPITSPTFLGDPKAPTATAGDNDTSIATTAFVTGAVATALGVAAGTTNVGRNKLDNPAFVISQRGLGPFSGVTYCADRWILALALDTVSLTIASLTDSDRAAIGDEEADLGLVNVFTGNAGAGAFTQYQQRIEDVFRLANKTVTVSFWAKAASGTPKIGISIDQIFNGSATVQGSGQTVTLSTTWTRYTKTLTIGSLATKTIGAASYTQLNLWLSSGTTNATRAGSIGVQSGTISLWGVQLEIGSVATAFEKMDYAQQILNAYRFYQLLTVNLRGAYSAGPANFFQSHGIQPMRATPTTNLIAAGSSANVGGFTVGGMSANTIAINLTSSAAGDAFVSGSIFSLSADL